jgi:hypothetical protein
MGLEQQLEDFRQEFLLTTPAERPALYEANIEVLRSSSRSKPPPVQESFPLTSGCPTRGTTSSASPICSRMARLWSASIEVIGAPAAISNCGPQAALPRMARFSRYQSSARTR